MARFEDPVESRMTRTVVTVSIDDDVQVAEQLLRLHDISSLPVVGRDGDLAGVISFRDLLNAGHVLGRMLGARTALTLPAANVGELMTPTPISVAPSTSILEAAKIMVTRRIHRVYVVEAGSIVGVLTTNDLVRIVGEGSIAVPITRYATSPVLTIDASATLFQAVEMLASSFVSGLVVVDDGLPCGLFTQLEALARKDLDDETRVGDVVEYSVITLPWRTPLFRAAAFASNGRARRVLAMDGTDMQGILSGLDFIRAGVEHAG